MFFLLPLVGVAVGAAVGAIVTHAAHEKDRQAATHHRNIANELTTKYSQLEKRYNQLADESKKQITALTRQHAVDEVEKDVRDLVIELQNEVISVLLNIDKDSSLDTLNKLITAIAETNQVLSHLNRSLISIPNEYFTRNLIYSSTTFSSLSDEWLNNLELNTRVALAFDLSTPSFILEKLARDPHAEVRKVVADHPYTPTTVLRELAHDNPVEVREAVTRNPNIQIALEQKVINLSRAMRDNSFMAEHLL